MTEIQATLAHPQTTILEKTIRNDTCHLKRTIMENWIGGKTIKEEAFVCFGENGAPKNFSELGSYLDTAWQLSEISNCLSEFSFELEKEGVYVSVTAVVARHTRLPFKMGA